MLGKEQIKQLAEANKVKKVELCRYAGVHDRYYHMSKAKPFLLHSLICLIAEKKGVDIMAILNLKEK